MPLTACALPNKSWPNEIVASKQQVYCFRACGIVVVRLAFFFSVRACAETFENGIKSSSSIFAHLLSPSPTMTPLFLRLVSLWIFRCAVVSSRLLSTECNPAIIHSTSPLSFVRLSISSKSSSVTQAQNATTNGDASRVGH